MAVCATAAWSTGSGSGSGSVSGRNRARAYQDLDAAAMHFWIDKRSAGPHGHGRGRGPPPPPGLGPRSRHRVAASLASSWNADPSSSRSAAPQRRRRPPRTAPKSTGPGNGNGSSSMSSGLSQPLVHRGGGGGGAGGESSATSERERPPPRRFSRPLLTRHLGLPRPHLAYIGSTGSGFRADGGLDSVLVDIPLEGGHMMGSMVTSASDRALRTPGSAAGSLHDRDRDRDSPPVLMDRFTCGLWASFALASVFVAGTKFYLDFQSSGMEALVLSLLLMIFLIVGCTASICRARVNSQLAAAHAAAAAAVTERERERDADGDGLAAPLTSAIPSSLAALGHPDELAVLIGRPDQMERSLERGGRGRLEGVGVQQQQLQLQLAEQPPPPYHIAMLSASEQPPPAYEKVVT